MPCSSMVMVASVSLPVIRVDLLQLRIPAGDVEQQLGRHGDLAVDVVTAVELDDVEVTVLAVLEKVVVNDQAGTVPVVVAVLRLYRVAVEFPQLLRLVAVVRE